MITEDNKNAAGTEENGAAANTQGTAPENRAGKEVVKTLDALNQDVDNALAAKNKAAQDYAGLKDGTDEDITKFSNAVSETSQAYDAAVKLRDARLKGSKSSKGQREVRILLPPAGVYFLPYNVGDVVKLDAELAAEMTETKYAEYTSKK